MKASILENVNVYDKVALYTIKGDIIHGVVTIKDDNSEIIGLQKDADCIESRFAYALIAGCDIIGKPSSPIEQQTPPLSGVNDSAEVINFAGVVQIALEQGINDLPEWRKIVNKYLYAAKVGEFAKKHNRIGPILAELSSIKESFSDKEKYEEIRGFFVSLEERMDASISAAKEGKSTIVQSINSPEKSSINTEFVQKPDISTNNLPEQGKDDFSKKMETSKITATPIPVEPITKPSTEIIGTVINTHPNKYDKTKCYQWAVRTDNGETYRFSERNIEDDDLRNSLINKFSRNIMPNEKVVFHLLRVYGKYGEQITFANRVRSIKPEVKVDTKLENDYQNALKFFTRGKDKDTEALPVFLKYFEIRPSAKIANNICTIYIRLDKPLQAIEFTETERVKLCLSKEEYLNIRYQAYRKASLVDKAVEAQKDIVKITKNDANKAHHLIYIIQYAYVNKDYDETLHFCERWLETDVGKSVSISDARVARLGRYAAGSIVRLKESGKTPKISRALEKLIQSDENANAILAGEASAPDDIFLSNELSRYANSNELSFPPELDDLGELSKWLMYSLDVSKPPIVIPQRVVSDNNMFSGGIKQAKKIVNAVTARDSDIRIQSKNPNDRYERCLYAARILLDAIILKYNDNQIGWYPDEDTDKVIDMMFSQLTKAFASKGDYILLSKPDEAHSSRLYYIETVKCAKNKRDQDLQNAVVRCILSIFVDTEIIQEIMRQRKDENVFIRNIVDYLDMDAQYTKMDINLFLGVLIRIITNNNILRHSIQDTLLEAVFKSRRTSDIARGLFNSINREFNEGISQQEFNEAVDEFRKLYSVNERSFILFIDRVKNLSFQREWIEDTRKELFKIEKFFTYADAYDKKNCFDFFIHLLNLAEQVYHLAGLFNEQEHTLKSIREQITTRIHEIKETPSYYSYRYMLATLKKWLDFTEQTLGDLYVKNPPKILIEIVSSNMLILNEDGFVEIDIYVSNEGGQSADSVRVRIIVNDDSAYDVNSINEGPSRTIKGGDKKDVSAVLNMTDRSVKAFPISIQVEYSYKGLNGKMLDETYFNEIPVSFGENHFVDMDNPYIKEVESSGMRNRSMMYGRDSMIRKYIELLRGDSELPIKSKTLLFYGQKRAGKTTVLQFLTEDLKNEVSNVIIVKIGDILNVKPERTKSFEAVLYKRVFWEISDDINERHHSLKEAMRAEGINIPMDSEISTAADWRYTANKFFTKFNKLIEEKEEFSKTRIVFIIDEFTRLYGWIQDGLVDRDFMQYWKVMIQEYGIVAIVVAQDYVEEFANAFPNTFGAIEEIQVDYLKIADVRKMVLEPFSKMAPWGAFQDKYADETIERIMELTAGSAYFTMIFLDRLVRYMNENNRQYVIRRTVDMVLQDEILGGNDPLSLAKFDSLYNDGSNIDDANRKVHNLIVLWRIALYQDERKCGCPKSDIKIPEDINVGSGFTPIRISELVDKLYKRGVLLRENRMDEYCIRVGMFKEWLVKKCSADTINSLIKDDNAGERL